MFESLDAVPWSNLGHAYGTAEDVPVLLRQAMSDNQDERNEAWNELYGNLWHQGTVYEATAPAVPFLIDMLDADLSPCRQEAANYLIALAHGNSYLDVHAPLFPEVFANKEAELNEELHWVAAARAAVAAGGERYRALFASKNAPPVRAALVRLMALAESARYVAGIAADDPQVEVRAAAALVLSGCGDRCQVPPAAGQPDTEGIAAAMASLAQADADPYVRWCAALAAVRRAGDDAGQVAIAAVTAALIHQSPAGIDDLLEEIGWDPPEAAYLAPMALRACSDAELASVIAGLAGGMADMKPPHRTDLAMQILEIAVPERPFSPTRRLALAELTARERHALEVLAACPALWTDEGRPRHRMEPLKPYGLSWSRIELQDYLADKPPVPPTPPKPPPPPQTTVLKAWWNPWS